MTLFLYVTTVLIWGSTWFAIKFQLGVVPEEWSIAYRFAFAALCMFVLAIWRRKPLRHPIPRHIAFAGLGLCLFSLNYLMVYEATIYVATGLVAVGFSLLTIFNIMNGRIFLGRPFDRWTFIGSLCGLAGIALVFSPEIEGLSLKDDAALGISLILGGALLASLGNTIAAKKDLAAQSVISTSAWGMGYGALFMAGIAVAKGHAPSFDPSPDYVISLLYLSIFGTVIAFSAYLSLFRRIGMERAAYANILFPVVAVIISVVLEDFSVSLPTVAGIVLILGGNVAVLRRN